MIPATLNPDSGQELDIITAIRSGAEVSVCIPDDISNHNLFNAIHSLGSSISKSDRFGRAARYLLGMAMTMAARRPSFLPDYGFANFKEFEEALILQTGLERSTLWRWKPIYEQLPELTRDQLERISAEHFTLILKIPDNQRRQQALEAAPEMSYRRFQRFAEDEGLVAPGEAEGASLILSGSKDQVAELREFLENDQIRNYCGTTNHLEMILMMKAETQSGFEWPKI